MKKILILFIGLLATGAVFAQRYNTASNINLNAGILDKGYTANLGYEKFLNSKTSINIGANYLNREQKVKNVDNKAELSSYFLDVKYKYYLTDQGKIFPYAGAGLFGGYQTFDNSKDYPSNLKIELEDSAIYGIIGEVGIEYNIQSISFVFKTTPMYEFKNEKILLPVKFGIKYFY